MGDIRYTDAERRKMSKKGLGEEYDMLVRIMMAVIMMKPNEGANLKRQLFRAWNETKHRSRAVFNVRLRNHIISLYEDTRLADFATYNY